MLHRLLRTEREEIMDREGLSDRGRTLLADLDRWNRISGWYPAHVRRVRRHWEALGRPSPMRVLDVGTGSGGLLLALAQSGLPLDLTGIDRSPDYVAYGREKLGSRATIVEGDATALPWPDGSFDLVTNTLMMHHLPLAVRRSLVAEMARVARSAYLFDLEVTLYGFAGFHLLGRLVGLGPDTVADGALSVRRGSTFAEFRALVEPLPVVAQRVFPSALCTMPR
jgi:SAM-dependent methyltransferase